MSSITCRELIEFLDDYVAGSLTPPRAEIFEAHLRVCPDCIAYLAEYRLSIKLARELRESDPAGPIPGGVPPEMVAAVRRAINPNA